MATERQIAANRANAAKSTGPVTPEGKRISSQNASLCGFLTRPVILKGASLRRYNAFASALMHQFQPRDSVEIALIQLMTLARWRLLSARETQTADLRREIARARSNNPPGAPESTLAAIAFRSLAEDSRSFARQHQLEAFFYREYLRALAKLLKLREIPKPSAAPSCPRKSGARDFQTEANLETVSAPLSEEHPAHKQSVAFTHSGARRVKKRNHWVVRATPFPPVIFVIKMKSSLC